MTYCAVRTSVERQWGGVWGGFPPVVVVGVKVVEVVVIVVVVVVVVPVVIVEVLTA